MAQCEVCGNDYDKALQVSMPGEVREDGTGGVDRILTLQADEAFAPAETLLASGVEAGLSRPRAADRHPMPVEDERLGSKLQSTITPEFRFRAHLADKVEVELTVM